ncbi:MAG: alpha/beta fold hydrolase [Anaerolineae bacterium]
MWSLNIKDLSKNYRTYAFDSLINTGSVGRSTYTRQITHVEEATNWLDELFAGLGITERINLVGPSYGGWLASHYTLYNSNRINKLVLLAPAGTILPFSRAYLLRMLLMNLLPFRFTYRHFFRWSFPDLAKKDSHFLEALIEEFIVSTRSFVASNFKESPTLTAMSDDQLQGLDVPTLVLIGENEVLYSAQEAVQRLETVAPYIQKEIIPDAGHDLLLVQMEMVNQKILTFLA